MRKGVKRPGMRHAIRAVLCVLFLALSTTARADGVSPPTSHFETGAFLYSSATVGDERVDLAGVDVRWRGTRGEWTFRAAFPLLSASTSGGLVLLGPFATRIRAKGGEPASGNSGAGGPNGPADRDGERAGGSARDGGGGSGGSTPGATRRADSAGDHGRETGVGDLQVQLARWITKQRPAGRISVRAGAKLPTADESKGLGTGETDLWLGLGWRRQGWGADVEATAGWVHLGDPSDLELRDGPAMEFAIEWPRNRWGLRASVDALASRLEDEPTRIRAVAGVHGPLTQRVFWTGEVSAGLTDSAPDVGLELSVGF